jgi:hypothetical protein
MARENDAQRIDMETGSSYASISRESVAYDYSRFDTRERWVQPPAELEIVRPRTKRRSRASAITPNLVLLALIFAALSIGVVWSSMILTEKNNMSAGLKSDINKLKSEATMLQTRQDERFSLAAVEAYAADELKMVKLTNEHLKYIDVSNPDKIELLDPSAESGERPLLVEVVEWLGVNK